MTTVAEKFLNELQSGQISEAIDTIKLSLREMTIERINESRTTILHDLGFVVNEKDDDKDDVDEDEEGDDDGVDEPKKIVKEKDDEDDEDEDDDEEEKSKNPFEKKKSK